MKLNKFDKKKDLVFKMGDFKAEDQALNKIKFHKLKSKPGH